jgi:hypothetical protein
MDKLFNSLATHSEILTIGIISFCSLLILLYPQKSILDPIVRIWNLIAQFILGNKKSNQSAQYLRTGVVIAFLYFWGTIVNITTYWVMWPAHTKVVYTANVICQTKNDSTLNISYLQGPQFNFFLLPVPGFREVPQNIRQAQISFYKDEMKWLILKSDTFSTFYSGSLESARLIRWTAVCTLILFIAMLVRFFYRIFYTILKHQKKPFYHHIYFNLIYVILAAVIYFCCMQVYWFFELEFHIKFILGAILVH